MFLQVLISNYYLLNLVASIFGVRVSLSCTDYDLDHLAVTEHFAGSIKLLNYSLVESIVT